VRNLHALGVPPDELALDFDDISNAADDVLSRNPDARDVRQKLSLLDQKLSEMSGPAHTELWTVEALHKAPEWNEVRDDAGALLRELSSLMDQDAS
jgi:hypothetical protein